MVIYISVLTGALITLALLHRRAHQHWEDRLVNMSRAVAELEGRIDALSTATEDQEYYICHDGRALVHNYAVDAWYVYESFDAVCLLSFHGDLYIGTGNGRLKQVSYAWRGDDEREIDCYWESGSMSFNADYMRKYAATLWVGIKPEANSEVGVTVQTDKRSNYAEKLIVRDLATFAKANFARWCFYVNRKPQMTRLKIKAKKFVFYKLVFQTMSADTTCTVLAADIKVRYTGAAK